MTFLGVALAVFTLAGCGPERPLERAKEALDASALEAAERGYRRVLERWPDEVAALYGLGQVYLLAGQPDRAREYFQRCTVVAPGDWRGFKGLAAVAMASERLAEARTALTTALRLAPDEPAVLTSQGLLLLVTGEPEQAREVLARAAALRPDDGGYRLNHAEALYRLDRLEDALAEVDAGLAVGTPTVRIRAQLLGLRARSLVRMTAGALDPARCAEAVPGIQARLEEAERSAVAALEVAPDLAELGAVRQWVRRRRAFVQEQCPGMWQEASP